MVVAFTEQLYHAGHCPGFLNMSEVTAMRRASSAVSDTAIWRSRQQYQIQRYGGVISRIRYSNMEESSAVSNTAIWRSRQQYQIQQYGGVVSSTEESSAVSDTAIWRSRQQYQIQQYGGVVSSIR